MAGFIFEASDVNFKYQDGTKALNNLSISIEKGKKIAFLGSNGAGKTTFFLHLNGVLRPSEGVIKFLGRDIAYNRKSMAELRKKVGIVFQDPDSQLFSASVAQDISFGPYNMGLSDNEVLARVKEAMEATDVAFLKDRPTQFLSYGQKKRVSIAGILAMDPEVLIFDEPTACLDPRLSLHVMALLDRLNADGKTVILSIHDVDLAYSWADYIFVMNKGSVAGEGTPEEIFLDDRLLRSNNLERPWIVEVYRELVNKGWLSEDSTIPRTKRDLLENIPGYSAGRTHLKKINQSGC